jgi:hypothetical protein
VSVAVVGPSKKYETGTRKNSASSSRTVLVGFVCLPESRLANHTSRTWDIPDTYFPKQGGEIDFWFKRVIHSSPAGLERHAQTPIPFMRRGRH